VFLAVVVVFLNEERFLPRLLSSVAGQTRAPDRLLLVDDGSEDASPSIARDFADAYPYAEALCGRADRLKPTGSQLRQNSAPFSGPSSDLRTHMTSWRSWTGTSN
jgi:glycosyltransferase involved in cell wall biosynthesis